MTLSLMVARGLTDVPSATALRSVFRTEAVLALLDADAPRPALSAVVPLPLGEHHVSPADIERVCDLFWTWPRLRALVTVLLYHPLDPDVSPVMCALAEHLGDAPALALAYEHHGRVPRAAAMRLARATPAPWVPDLVEALAATAFRAGALAPDLVETALVVAAALPASFDPPRVRFILEATLVACAPLPLDAAQRDVLKAMLNDGMALASALDVARAL